MPCTSSAGMVLQLQGAAPAGNVEAIEACVLELQPSRERFAEILMQTGAKPDIALCTPCMYTHQLFGKMMQVSSSIMPFT